MLQKVKKIALLTLTACLLQPSTIPYAEEAKITDVLISMKNGEIMVVGKLQGCFTPKIESAIMAGIPTTFTFIIHLYEERPFWFDRRLKTVSEAKTIKYDLLKKIFYISSTQTKEAIAVNDFETAKKVMSDYIVTMHVQDVLKKSNHSSYYVKMKAKMDKIRLPFRLELVLFFVSLWDFETDWYRQEVVF
ncbi:MAG: DUF4390 domain-containing protein [Syntrophales bacterium]|nr:DUF4390 domain-containing protein [Syntrophales bacterium]